MEVQTPSMNPWSTPEPFLYPFWVVPYGSAIPDQRRADDENAINIGDNASAPTPIRDHSLQPVAGLQSPASLITSPEFNLKILWSELRSNIFEIAHCFRGQEYGTLHSQEFLMLEWYACDYDEFKTIHFIHSLILGLLQHGADCFPTLVPTGSGTSEAAEGDGSPKGTATAGNSAGDAGPGRTGHHAAPARKSGTSLELEIHSIKELFRKHLDCGLEKEELIRVCEEKGHFRHDTGAQKRARRYEEYFFTLFLNYIEAVLPLEKLVAVHGYPEPLSAYASLENGRARRFEIYWRGLELANGYRELTDAKEQRNRMMAEARLKKDLTGLPPALPEQFLAVMQTRGLPDGCGVALGLERLLMALTGSQDIRQISPFPSTPGDPG